MHPAATNRERECGLKICRVGRRVGGVKLAAASRGALAMALISALLVMAGPAQGQTGSALYSFAGGSDGANPLASLVADGAGNLYGTTFLGGAGVGRGHGTVFELSPNGGGGWNETVLYSFTGGADGGYPLYANLTLDGQGNLYGTASAGGAHGMGVVFELSPAGGSWTETVLYNFSGGTDGASPISGLVKDAAGNYYGATNAGGAATWGVIYELSPSGGGWTEQVIYTFVNQVDINYDGLAMDSAGNIFTATYAPGTILEVSPNGQGGWSGTVIHTYAGPPKDGAQPSGTPVVGKDGSLYGTTRSGGANNFGTVYRLTPITKGKKKGTWKEKILYSFKGGTKDGSSPFAGITFDAAGNIYGTTITGGTTGVGTVYELVAPVGKGGYKEKVLWSLARKTGSSPFDSVILDSAGNVYGTAYQGGANGDGGVFEVSP